LLNEAHGTVGWSCASGSFLPDIQEAAIRVWLVEFQTWHLGLEKHRSESSLLFMSEQGLLALDSLLCVVNYQGTFTITPV